MGNVRNNRVLELADLRFIAVATIEEENIIATLFYQLIHLVRLEVLATVDDAFFTYFDINTGAEIN